jgi:putative transcription factor
MGDSDWDTVTVLRKRPQKASALRTQQAVNAAQRQGIPVETSKKFNAATNKNHVGSLNTAKLDRESEELHHDRIGMDVGKLIQKARQEKGMTQKELATKICEKIQVVNDFEAGRALPNQQVLSKMERALGTKLRGKDKGQALPAKEVKK